MKDNTEKLERELSAARTRLEAAGAALAPKHKGGELEAFRVAHDEVLHLERLLAAARNEPHAVPCGFPVEWDVGAPLPFLLCNDYRTFLTFYVRQPRPDWDGTSVKVIDPACEEKAALCLVKFKNCVSAKLGHPNDEAQFGHPLAGCGLEGYTAQIVKNSPWLKDVARTNSVHPQDNPERWKCINHYAFWFHDSTFECLAESYDVEMSSETMSDLLSRVQRMLIE